MPHAIIIGASHAAAQACVSLRQTGWEGEITVIGDEKDLPYHRPPLSKDFLSGQKNIDEILIRPADAYAKANVTFKLGTRVTGINASEKTIATDKDGEMRYDKPSSPRARGSVNYLFRAQIATMSFICVTRKMFWQLRHKWRTVKRPSL